MKQFSKIKQFADKAFVRPDKTEVLSDDLLEAERHLELIKQTLEVTLKKLGGCIPGQAKEGTPVEKRIKKVPEYMLGLSMSEFGSRLGRDSILGEVLEEVGKIEMRVGHEVPGYETRTESVLASLQTLLDTDFPAIYKLKRQLAKLTETMDLARGKLSQISRHSSVLTGGGGGGGGGHYGGSGSGSTVTTSTSTKVEFCKDELEESQAKVEACRDHLSIEMYELLNREGEIATSIVQFLKYQQEYHSNISNILAELLPEVDNLLIHSDHKPVFGTDLHEHLVSSGRTIAYPLELCTCALLEIGLKEEGLLRIAGGSSRVKKLKSLFNSRLVDLGLLLSPDYSDPHLIATCLKCYLRELPNPLLTTELYSDWLQAIRQTDPQEKLNSLWNVIQSLPENNKANLKYLVKFLKKLTDYQEFNKMSSSNVAIVIGPNLLWKPNEGSSDDGMDSSVQSGSSSSGGLAMTQFMSSIIEILVTNAEWFFPGEYDFHLTCTRPLMDDLHNGVQSGDNLRRTQSTSSLDQDPSPPLSGSSPKPVIRRKTKPPPPAPPVLHNQQPKTGDAQQAKSRDPFSATTPYDGLGKRDGILGYPPPPSPSQMITGSNRKSLLAQGVAGAQLTKVPPPLKPPQPNFKEKDTELPLRKFDTLGNLAIPTGGNSEDSNTEQSSQVESITKGPGDVRPPASAKVPNDPSAVLKRTPSATGTSTEHKRSVTPASMSNRNEPDPKGSSVPKESRASPLRSKDSTGPPPEVTNFYSTATSLPRSHHRTASHPTPTQVQPILSTFTKPEVKPGDLGTSAPTPEQGVKSRSSSGDALPLRSTKSLDGGLIDEQSGGAPGVRGQAQQEEMSPPHPPLIGFESTLASLSRPVPAPRSSLLQQNIGGDSSAGGTGGGGVKPGLKAKPRGTKGGQSSIQGEQEQGQEVTGTTRRRSGSVPREELEVTNSNNQQIQQHQQDEGEDCKPRLPYRPPRPVPPPAPPKHKGTDNYSTDL